MLRMSPGAVLNIAPFVTVLLGVVRQEAFDSRLDACARSGFETYRRPFPACTSRRPMSDEDSRSPSGKYRPRPPLL